MVFDSSEAQPVNLLFELELVGENKYSLKAKEERVSLYSYESDRIVSFVLNFQVSRVFEFGETVDTKPCNFRIIKNPNGAGFLPGLVYHLSIMP
ncbi:MAG: hypothetical protein HC831_07545 [Chloroflexia bacterium]|nr:hypothetical protein [Chloroflexia bacterium]